MGRLHRPRGRGRTVELRPGQRLQRGGLEEGQLVRRATCCSRSTRARTAPRWPAPKRAGARAQRARLAAAQHDGRRLSGARDLARESNPQRATPRAMRRCARRRPRWRPPPGPGSPGAGADRRPRRARAGQWATSPRPTPCSPPWSRRIRCTYFEADEQTHRPQPRRRLRRDGDGRVVRVAWPARTGCRAGTLDCRQPGRSATGTIVRARCCAPRRAVHPACSPVQLAGAQQTRALLVDDKAVLTDQDRKYVWVLGEDDTAQRRDVNWAA